MILKTLTQAIRRIKNQSLFSAIKFLGLTIGLGCIIIISLWVQNELSFDTFHQSPENIYRVIMDMGEHGELALTPAPLIDKILDDFPEIENATRIEYLPKTVVKNDNVVFYEENGIFADPGFFNVFSFKLLSGNNSSLLNDPFNVVITSQFAQKYFENKDVLDKTLTIHGYPFKVTGILENTPYNSHLQFGFILPIQLKTLLSYKLDNWGDVNLYTYIKVKNMSDATGLMAKIKKWETPREESFFLQPLLKIHGDIHYIADNAKTTDRLYIFVFSSVAILILLIACINYTTLFLSASYNRSKEIVVMKIFGATRQRLVGVFMSETAIFIFASLCSALVLVEQFVPVFDRVTGTQIVINYFHLETISIIIIWSLILLLIIGIYPALHLSSLKTLSVFKKEKIGSGIISSFKNAMILIQFSITTVLIIGLITVSEQLKFIRNKDLGFQKENVVYLPYEGIRERYPSFKDEVLKNNSVLNVSIKNSLPVEVADKTTSIDWPGNNTDNNILFEATAVGFDYFQTMGIKITDGRDFSKEISTDKNSVILNNEAILAMNLDDPIGKNIRLWEDPATIIGVVNDALFYSLKENVGPQIFYLVQDYTDESMVEQGIILIKIGGSNIDGTIAAIKSVWNEFAPESPFTCQFLDQVIENKYRAENKMFALMSYFVVISILISCLGLFGSASYSSRLRIKEIAIRKVHGGKVSEILSMLNKDFMKWVVIAFIVACPIAYYSMNTWLENFAYKIKISWWIFALAGVLAMGIAMFTVSFQSWRVVSRNPVDALRYE